VLDVVVLLIFLSFYIKLMTWFSKAINFVKKHAPPDVAQQIDMAQEFIEGTVGFAKLTAEMAEAAVINIEEGLGKGYRAITGTGKRPVFNAQEGPLKSSVSLQDLAQITKHSYKPDSEMRSGYTLISSKEVKDLAFTVLQSEEDGHVVVSFRGSANFENWKRNLDFRRVDDGRGNTVHHGFKSAWDELKPYVDKELFDIFGQNTFTNNVTFTGHSLGGAIAQFATAEYASTQNPRLVDGVTFATPVVGDDGFNKSIPGGHLMNVVDPRDSVPKIVQQLQPDFKENTLARRWMPVGDRAARKNDEVKKDAIKFGIELSFDLGAALIMAYAPEVFEGAEEAGPEVDEILIEETLALEDAAIAAAEESAGLGAAAEEGAALEAIGASEGETFTSDQRLDLRSLFNAESRAQVREQLGSIDVAELTKNTVLNKYEKIDWEKTIMKTLQAKGVSKGAQNLIMPFISENTDGLDDIKAEQMEFLLQKGWDFMYGSVVAHPINTYIKNIDTRFGSQRDNARDDMWKNYQAHLKDEGFDDTELLEFMTEEELADFREGFAHGDAVAGVEDGEDEEGGEEEGKEGEEEEEGMVSQDFFVEAPQHTLAGHEANEISGRPLHVVTEGLGRKANGQRIFGVSDENGDVLSYSGPSHPASSTTLYGRWTGVAPFANDFPVKVSRQNAFGGQSYSALDTFSLAYLVNSYTNGYHNAEADQMYIKRISAAINNGFISESIDAEELRVAKQILREFNERGHLFGADTAGGPVQGNLLTEIDVLARGALNDIGDDVSGVVVGFGPSQKLKVVKMLGTRTGTGVARDILTRSSKRLKSGEVTSTSIVENSAQTIDFNLRAMEVLGLDKTPEYAVLKNGAKQNAMAYKTALNVEESLSRTIQGAQAQADGDVFDTNNPDSILPNVLGDYTSVEGLAVDERHLSSNAEHFKELAVAQILKSII
jgi:hypothetical protein